MMGGSKHRSTREVMHRCCRVTQNDLMVDSERVCVRERERERERERQRD